MPKEMTLTFAGEATEVLERHIVSMDAYREVAVELIAVNRRLEALVILLLQDHGVDPGVSGSEKGGE